MCIFTMHVVEVGEDNREEISASLRSCQGVLIESLKAHQHEKGYVAPVRYGL